MRAKMLPAMTVVEGMVIMMMMVVVGFVILR
jgi:hypothetical protein